MTLRQHRMVTRRQLLDAGLNDNAIAHRVRHGWVHRVYFEAERLIAELDGYAYHSDRAAFERERTRDLDANAGGIDTVRITQQPARVAARLEKILKERRG